jgi:hypothetical protein
MLLDGPLLGITCHQDRSHRSWCDSSADLSEPSQGRCLPRFGSRHVCSTRLVLRDLLSFYDDVSSSLD